MFIALNKAGERIEIDNADPQKQYFCPICGESLIIRAKDSLCRKTHFAHKKGTKCLDDWKHDMSEWHNHWQQCFPKKYREVVIENNGEKHRADICIGNTVIEFQHSPITGEEIAKRNEFYISCGYQVVWVFDATDKIINRYGGSINPMLCRADELCWKNAKSTFAIHIPSEVTIFLYYKIQSFNLMILITKMTPKPFSFHQTNPFYILPNNFLKEWGADFPNVPCVSDIIKLSAPHKISESYSRKTISNPSFRFRMSHKKRRF